MAPALPGWGPCSASRVAADPGILSPAGRGATAEVSPLALPVLDAAAAGVTLATSTSECDASIVFVGRRRYDSIHYRPRRARIREREHESSSNSGRSSAFGQLHGGFFDPDGT